MMQFGMEAFTNPPVIDNTIRYLAANGMFSNNFLTDFKLLDLWPLRAFGLLGTVSRVLKPATDGVALERANVYSYITAHYSMHNAQAHQPGQYADHQAVSSINLANDLSVFTTQPAKIPQRSGHPGYWAGNGRQPYSVQEKNVLMELYQPPEKPGFMEPMVVKGLTHVYFPVQHFDEVDESRLAQGLVYGRRGKAFIAIRSRHPLRFEEFRKEENAGDMLKRSAPSSGLKQRYDLVQQGPGLHWFITELSSSERESFADFRSRIVANAVSFDPSKRTLSLVTVLNGDSAPSSLVASFGGPFLVDGRVRDLEYPRFGSAYVPSGSLARKAERIELVFKGRRLVLDFNRNLRHVEN
ncbi:MAG: hypothetical protein FJ399_07920 [Verrucomicrobia bacterium]|nr:hypothetical protein [Verrucomicrobiota bacterium]